MYTSYLIRTRIIRRLQEEQALCEQYENLGLSKEQCKVIDQWADVIHAKNAAYSIAVFCMEMQCCFSLLIQLTSLE